MSCQVPLLPAPNSPLNQCPMKKAMPCSKNLCGTSIIGLSGNLLKNRPPIRDTSSAVLRTDMYCLLKAFSPPYSCRVCPDHYSVRSSDGAKAGSCPTHLLWCLLLRDRAC